MSRTLSTLPTPANRPPHDAALDATRADVAPVESRDDDDCRKQVPPNEDLRRAIHETARTRVDALSIEHTLTRDRIEQVARETLEDLGQPQDYLAWTMVAVGSAHWRRRVMAVPFDRRLVLLPHCMRDSENCPATYDETGLQCQKCGACPLADLKSRAEDLGCRVLIAEGSPIVMQLILTGRADAVLGVGCLNSLEKSFDKLLTAGVPGLAVPLHSCGCVDTETDLDVVISMLETPYRPGRASNKTWLHLLRGAHRLFEVDEFLRLLPPHREEVASRVQRRDAAPSLDDVSPIAATELLAYDFLLQGGKHFRPFITLAAYDAMTGGRTALGDGAAHFDAIPDSVRRTAMAIEIFHKASLVHDDIEDDDAYRYGRATLHRTHGTATAINVGDHLIGLGYRVVASQHKHLPSDAVADIAARLGLAHTKLAEGQGAELVWRDATDKRLAPIDALRIYALKTAPAFEVALFAGLRMAGPVGEHEHAIARFSRHLGVAFQILNDLEDWTPNTRNKRIHGGDVLGGRPTVLLSLALEALDDADQQELLSILDSRGSRTTDEAIQRVASLYAKAGVRRTATQLIARHAARARETAAAIPQRPLRELLEYFVDVIVGR